MRVSSLQRRARHLDRVDVVDPGDPRVTGRSAEERPEAVPGAPPTVLLVGSGGGHLSQLIALRPWWESWERSWVTFRASDACSQLEGEIVDFAHHPTTRNVGNLLRNFVVAARVLHHRRPDLVVSTGAAVAIPFFILGRLAGVKLVYIEVYDRVSSRTVTGRICRPLASAFLVQWEEQQRMYPGSTVIGRLL
jgi:UDP-N-acetylglucosamine:LPS N-acetylglucosamine transferase